MEIEIFPSEFVRLVREHFADADIRTIVEIGSLNGADSLFFKEQFPHARVVAIEGLGENFEKYMKQLEGIECVNATVADHNGETTFHVKDTNGIHSIFDRGARYGSGRRIVQCSRLDSIFNEPIDMMKVDVEGATYEVLVGMGDLLPKTKIMHIETEDYPFFQGQRLHDEVAALLDGAGFTMVKKTSVEIHNPAGRIYHQHDSVWIGNQQMKANVITLPGESQ